MMSRRAQVALIGLAMFAVSAGPSSAASGALRQQAPPKLPSGAGCQGDPLYRQFDFWVGSWDVFSPDGQKVGANRIELLLGGCMLLENWTSARGTSGKSINYVDRASKTWKQNWVSELGDSILYEGRFADGAMRFEGERSMVTGAKARSRMTFTPLPDGRVRQFIEQSTDGGKTWSVWFDGFYVKKAAAPGS